MLFYCQGDSMLYVNENDTVQGSTAFPEHDQAHIFCPKYKVR